MGKPSFSWKNLNYPVVLCPPMDGITDMAFRQLVAELGGSSAQYCEFVNVDGINYKSMKTLFELRFTELQRPIIAQLFGSVPESFYKAAKTTVKLGFDAIDINMGCPAHKVARTGCGCTLMGNTDVAREIVELTIKGANEAWKELGNTGDYEITAKMRLGINDEKILVYEHGKAMVEAGAQCIAIHGRTLKQMYTGKADWEPIKNFKKNSLDWRNKNGSNVRVFGSGDVKSLFEAFERIMTTGVDGVMIGRGCFGNPWVFKKEKTDKLHDLCIKAGWPNIVENIDDLPKEILEEARLELDNLEYSFEEVTNTAIRHAELLVQDKGEKGILQMRKHLAWYFSGFPGAKDLRSKLVVVNSVDDIRNVLGDFKKVENVITA